MIKLVANPENVRRLLLQGQRSIRNFLSRVDNWLSRVGSLVTIGVAVKFHQGTWLWVLLGCGLSVVLLGIILKVVTARSRDYTLVGKEEETAMELRGKVASIESDEMVVLNIGSIEGVKDGMRFVIFSEGSHVKDPDTGEDLGAVEVVKGRVQVEHVMPRMSRARVVWGPVQVRQRSWWDSLLMLQAVPRISYKLKVEASAELGVSLVPDEIVRVGDLVRQYLG